MRYWIFGLLLLQTNVLLTRDTIRCMSYNIRYDNPADGLDRWDSRKDALVGFIEEQNPDIIGFQELLHHQLIYLSSRLKNYKVVGVGRDDGIQKGEYSPIFFDSLRFELLHFETRWFAYQTDRPAVGWDAALPRIATILRLRDRRSSRTFQLINVHLDHIGATARLQSARLLLQWSEEIISGPQICMGDFNSLPFEPPVTKMLEAWSDSCPESYKNQGTFNGFEPDREQLRRIDYLFFKGTGLSVSHYQVLKPQHNERQLSDHYPVIVEFLLN